MQSQEATGRSQAAAPRPVAELLQCPASVAALLNTAATCLHFQPDQPVFRQAEPSRGLYLVVSGQFQRRTERIETRLTLGLVRAGDLVELAAALGDGFHTYTLHALTAGSVLLLPLAALDRAFRAHPPLRMRLLEELAREVSRAYGICSLARIRKASRRSHSA
jgi:CRP-like cAMP-binding protein